MLDILVEIGVEELPISEGERLIDEFGDSIRSFLADNSVKFEYCITTGSPRRIVLIIKKLVEKQADKIVKIYGPPKHIFFDAAGAVTKAGNNYLQKNSKQLAEIAFEQKEDSKNIEYAVFTQKIEGINSLELLTSNFEQLLMSLPLRKKMRWSAASMQFSRPVRWICAICNSEKLDIKIGDVKSDNFTLGHRFLSPETAVINSVDEYFGTLEKKYVIADKFLRKKILIEKIEKLLKNTDLKVELDAELLDINNFLVEYPNPFICEFPAEFLKLPEETLISTMKKHQKYFAVYDARTGKLSNKFIAVSNMTDAHIENIRRGNERVINARFEDAKFYYEDDLSKPLDYFNDKLKKITYIDGIGSVYNKTARMRKIIEYISGLLKIPAEDREDALTAAQLSKFDLATGMVYEFPQLQGIIGAHYALKKNIKNVIAEAVREHYLPAGNLKELPKTLVAKLTSLADKFDIISICFALNLKPTGSADPYAVRRACRGIIAIIRNMNVNIDIAPVFKFCIDIILNDLEKNKINTAELLNEILAFFKLRVENMLEEEGYDINFIKMASDTQIASVDVLTIIKKLDALMKLKDNTDFAMVLKAFKRMNNILKNVSGLVEVNKHLFNEPIETELYAKFSEIKNDVEKFIIVNDYEKIISALSQLGPVIDSFFDSVMVMDKNEQIKINRLSMLKEISDYYKNQYAF